MSRNAKILIGLSGVVCIGAANAAGQSCLFGEPPTDFCNTARVISGEPGQHVVLMDVANATASGETLCSFSVGHTVWFEVTPTVSGPMTISTCHPNTLYDTVVQVYSGGDNRCEFMSFESCNDDTDAAECNNGCSFKGSTVTINATAGVRYRFAVGSIDNNQVGCPLCLGVIVTIEPTCGDPPRNFVCSEARELPGSAGTHEVSIDLRDMPSFPEDWACNENVGSNVWFRFKAMFHGVATFSTCNPNTTYDTVVRALTGDCAGLLASIACNDDSPEGACNNDCRPSSGTKVTFPVSTSQEYFLEVGSYANNGLLCSQCLGAALEILDCDTLAPPVAEITSPLSFGCTCDGTDIEGTAKDPGGFLVNYTLEYRPAAQSGWTLIKQDTSSVNGGRLATWNTAGLSDGWYFLRLTVRNMCGLTATAVNIVRVGSAFDTLRLDTPGIGAILGGNICFDGTAWDQSCFDHYTVSYRPGGSGLFSPVEPGSPTYTATRINQGLATWQTAPSIPDGGYQVRLNGIDRCGNQAEVSADITVDNTPPTAMISSPLHCEYVDGNIQVIGTAADANLAGWVLQYAGGPSSGWTTIASGTNSIFNGVLGLWQTESLAPCAYLLRLVVTDKTHVNCNGAIHNRSEYLVSVNVGFCGDFDVDNDGDVDLVDYQAFSNEFGGPLP